jgi:hypothetical protein
VCMKWPQGRHLTGVSDVKRKSLHTGQSLSIAPPPPPPPPLPPPLPEVSSPAPEVQLCGPMVRLTHEL